MCPLVLAPTLIASGSIAGVHIVPSPKCPEHSPGDPFGPQFPAQMEMTTLSNAAAWIGAYRKSLAGARPPLLMLPPEKLITSMPSWTASFMAVSTQDDVA